MDCCRCFLPIHAGDAKDYLGNRVAHRYPRCVELLHIKLAETRSYPHMCRMDHEEIGHRDSSEERCPMCRMRDEYEAQLAQYRWRRVEEERPMEGLRVLAYPADDIAVVTLRYDTEGREYWEDDYMTQMWPTHWMPLPPAPGEVE